MYKTKKRIDEKPKIYLYILELQYDKYYIGITSNLKKRMYDHGKGVASSFSRRYLPIKSQVIALLDTTNRGKALKLETNKTLEFIDLYGIENIAGGKIVGDLNRKKKWYAKVIKRNEVNAQKMRNKFSKNR